MIVTLVHIWVKDAFIEAFVNATIDNHRHSIEEPGNLRFDILCDADNPAKFVLYEAYETEKDAADHKNTTHYLNWRNAVADWMAQPRQGMKHTIVYPVDKEQW